MGILLEHAVQDHPFITVEFAMMIVCLIAGRTPYKNFPGFLNQRK